MKLPNFLLVFSFIVIIFIILICDNFECSATLIGFIVSMILIPNLIYSMYTNNNLNKEFNLINDSTSIKKTYEDPNLVETFTQDIRPSFPMPYNTSIFNEYGPYLPQSDDIKMEELIDDAGTGGFYDFIDRDMNEYLDSTDNIFNIKTPSGKQTDVQKLDKHIKDEITNPIDKKCYTVEKKGEKQFDIYDYYRSKDLTIDDFQAKYWNNNSRRDIRQLTGAMTAGRKMQQLIEDDKIYSAKREWWNDNSLLDDTLQVMNLHRNA